MKKFLAAATMCGAVMLQYAVATAQEKCGLDLYTQKALQERPELSAVIAEHSQQSRQLAEAYEAGMSNSAMKTTATTLIPVVFHVALNQAQIDQIGGVAGINERIVSQMQVINNDYNLRNTDTAYLPSFFKPLVGNPQISFALAHRKPDGTGTTGIEIRVLDASKTSFAEMDKAVKNTSFGGLDPWDNKKYLNIWIVNIETADLMGYAYSPNYARNVVGDEYQTGVVIDYGAFGVKPLVTPYFWHGGATRGRVLTHELGHYFNLWHTWGRTPIGQGDCAQDDDVQDTPPQFDATQQCPTTQKLTDQCTPGGNGIMYVNYMDYSGEGCTRMFTKQQAARMRVEVSPGGDSYGLTQNPELISWPTGVNEVAASNGFDVYPNPSTGLFTVNIDNISALRAINVVNMMGQPVKQIAAPDKTSSVISIDLMGMPKGIYMVQCTFDEGTVSRKVMIQ